MSADTLPPLPCGECGMPCAPDEFHPFAACLMFKGCHNSKTVRANLAALAALAAKPPPICGEGTGAQFVQALGEWVGRDLDHPAAELSIEEWHRQMLYDAGFIFGTGGAQAAKPAEQVIDPELIRGYGVETDGDPTEGSATVPQGPAGAMKR